MWNVEPQRTSSTFKTYQVDTKTLCCVPVGRVLSPIESLSVGVLYSTEDEMAAREALHVELGHVDTTGG